MWDMWSPGQTIFRRWPLLLSCARTGSVLVRLVNDHHYTSNSIIQSRHVLFYCSKCFHSLYRRLLLPLGFHMKFISIKIAGFRHSPVDFRAYSRTLPLTPTYSRTLPLTPAYSSTLPLMLMHKYRRENDKSQTALFTRIYRVYRLYGVYRISLSLKSLLVLDERYASCYLWNYL